MKIGYLIVGENITAPLLRRQVIELLANIKNRNPSFHIRIFNFQSVLSIIRHHNDLRKLNRELREMNITQWIIPNICPWPLPNLGFKKTMIGWRPDYIWNRFAASIFSILAIPWLLFFDKILGYHILHCRSYISTLIAIKYKTHFSKIKIIFDPRSDFPEEGATAGFWKIGDRNFLFWKDKEQKLLEQSSVVALIGPTYLDHYKENSGNFKYFYAANNVNTRIFKRDDEKRCKIRNEFNYSNDTIVFVYLGALTNDGWHRPEFYKRFYEIINKSGLRFALLVLTPEHCRTGVQKIFSNLDKVNVISPRYDEVGSYLSAADIGLMFLHKRKIAVGTKIGEYLCAGLPCIVNPNCLGAVDLIERNSGFGKIVNLALGDDDDHISERQTDIDEIMALKELNPRLDATRLFDIEMIADSYAYQYSKI